MRNPFEYGGVVRGTAFCNRRKEVADLARAMGNREKLFVFSERRMGKTSLVRAALGTLRKREWVCAYADLWPTDNEAMFVTAVAKAITESMSHTVGNALKIAQTFFGSLTPSITVSDDGRPVLQFGLAPNSRPGPVLDEVLEIPQRIARERGIGVVIVLDEFQQIFDYADDRVERKLRSIIQNQRDVAYLFLGSRKHLIEQMMVDRGRPLYRSGGHYPLGPIDEKHWQPFIRRRFTDAGKKIGGDRIHELCVMTQGHPFYTQHLCHALWERCESGREVTANLLHAAVQTLLERESYAYSTLWDSLTTAQRRLLRGLAGEDADVQVFSGEFIQSHGLRAASTVQRAIATLLTRDLIDREVNSYFITDRFFRLWIQNGLMI